MAFKFELEIVDLGGKTPQISILKCNYGPNNPASECLIKRIQKVGRQIQVLDYYGDEHVLAKRGFGMVYQAGEYQIKGDCEEGRST